MSSATLDTAHTVQDVIRPLLRNCSFDVGEPCPTETHPKPGKADADAEKPHHRQSTIKLTIFSKGAILQLGDKFFIRIDKI